MPEQTSGNPGNATRLARPTAPLALRYGLALVSVAVALGLARTYLYFQLPLPFTALSLSAITITFWYGGTKPGILAALLATAIRTSFFEPQVRSVSRAV
jgi:hypothetical protein